MPGISNDDISVFCCKLLQACKDYRAELDDRLYEIDLLKQEIQRLKKCLDKPEKICERSDSPI